MNPRLKKRYNMKIICTTENFIGQNTSCRKEYCCDDFKAAMEDHKYGTASYESSGSDFTLTKTGTINLQTHSCSERSNYMKISYCPFCGTKLVVEQIKVDNTNILPKTPPLKTVELKKKHWWQKIKFPEVV